MTEAAESTNTQAADAPFEIVRRPAPAGSEGLVIDIIGYRERVGQLIRQTESAALVAPLIISFGEPFEIGLGREPGRSDRYGSFAAGLCAAPALINSYGAAHCLQVNFTPLGARLATGATVWSVSRDLEIGVSHGGRTQLTHARRIIIATDRLSAFDLAIACIPFK